MAENLVNEGTTTIDVENIDPNAILAKVIKKDDGYHVIDNDGTEGPVCKLVDEGVTIALTKNASNRKYVKVKAVDEACATEDGFYGLNYKATIKIGPRANRMPNEKLIAYLSEDEQAEYKAIMGRAMAAFEAYKAEQNSPVAKAKAKAERAKKAYEEALAAAKEAGAKDDEIAEAIED